MTASIVAIAPLHSPRRRFVIGGVFVVLGIIMAVAFAAQAPSGTATFTWDIIGVHTFLKVPAAHAPVHGTVYAFAVICLALGAYQIARGFGEWMRVAASVVGVLFLFSFIEWGVAGQEISLVYLAQLTLLTSIPLVLGALSGVLCERSGVINIAIEGQFLVGAFAAAVASSSTGSPWAGLIAAGFAGLLIALVLAVFAIRYAVDQIIVGVVLNVFALGLTTFLLNRLLVPHQNLNTPAAFSAVHVPGLARIPIVGPLLFNVNLFLYIAIGLVIVVHVGLFRTRWGLRVRAVGEHPKAADTVGIKVNRIRYSNVLLGGVVAGIGGAYLTIGTGISFEQNMSSGKGFIALAAMIFGRWSPIGAVLAALLFGFSDALQSIFGTIGVPIPSYFLLMAPYIATLVAVAGLVGRVRPPAADGRPYQKQ